MRKFVRLTAILVLLTLAAGAGFAIQAAANVPNSGVQTVRPAPSDDVLANPFMGFAPPASHDPYDYPHRLVYAVVTWRELEPQRGFLDFESLERRFRFEDWERAGVRVILRFVMDYATDERHMDIPDWLYESTEGDGIWYDEDVGQGYSPNYGNPALIEEHARLIAALGERYNGDPRIAFVALGSLGHWGEWHTYSDDETVIPFPPLAVSDEYVRHYLDAFPDVKLLMRRPHPIASEHRIGLYNDVFGSERSTADFVDWFENGYYSVLAGGVDMPAMPDFWRKAPSGGEFANADEVRGYVQADRIEDVLAMIRRSHVSWLGPSSPALLDLSDEERRRLDRIYKTMGYRLRVSEAAFPETAVQGRPFDAKLAIRNAGVAPFYYGWPLELALADASGGIVHRVTVAGTDARDWLPGETEATASFHVPRELPAGRYALTVALLDPDTGEPGVDFAMEGRRPDGRYGLGSLTVRPPVLAERIRSWLPQRVTRQAASLAAAGGGFIRE